jgi:hypothetical protein
VASARKRAQRSSLPWNVARNPLQSTATVLAYFRGFWRRGVCRRLPLVATTGLPKGSIPRSGWDCHGREDVLRTLRERHAQGFAAGSLEFRDVGGDTVIVVSHPSEFGGPEWPAETATVCVSATEKSSRCRTTALNPRRLLLSRQTSGTIAP